MTLRTPTKITFTERPLHSDGFRASMPEGAVMDPAKAGAIVAMASPERLDEIKRGLEGLGLIVAGCTTREELIVYLVSSIERPDIPVPEVLVLDAALLQDDGELVEILRKADCLDNMIVILPVTWPRGVTPQALEKTQVLQDPFPMTVLVEEVARKMTPSSVALG